MAWWRRGWRWCTVGLIDNELIELMGEVGSVVGPRVIRDERGRRLVERGGGLLDIPLRLRFGGVASLVAIAALGGGGGGGGGGGWVPLGSSRIM